MDKIFIDTTEVVVINAETVLVMKDSLGRVWRSQPMALLSTPELDEVA